MNGENVPSLAVFRRANVQRDWYSAVSDCKIHMDGTWAMTNSMTRRDDGIQVKHARFRLGCSRVS